MSPRPFPVPPPPPCGRTQLPSTGDIWRGVTPLGWAGAGDRPRPRKHVPGVYIVGAGSTHRSAGCCPCLFAEGSRPGHHRGRRVGTILRWPQLCGYQHAGGPRKTQAATPGLVPALQRPRAGAQGSLSRAASLSQPLGTHRPFSPLAPALPQGLSSDLSACSQVR